MMTWLVALQKLAGFAQEQWHTCTGYKPNWACLKMHLCFKQGFAAMVLFLEGAFEVYCRQHKTLIISPLCLVNNDHMGMVISIKNS